jgi:hypothetical protein
MGLARAEGRTDENAPAGALLDEAKRVQHAHRLSD